MKKLNLFILHGTSRQDNRSLKAAKYLAKLAEQRENLEVTLKSVADFNVSDKGTNEDSKHPEYTKLVEQMDAMYIVVPEYNHSFPGSLKSLLDSEYQLYFRKAVSLMGVSTGRFAGARAVEHIVPVLRELGLVSVKNSTYVGNIKESVAEDGESAEDYITDAINQNLDDLIWMAETLRWGRDSL